MSTIIYILVALLIFGVLVAVHELGHFLAAKSCGVKVNEFSIGMGPKLWQRERGETLYTLRAIPCGGFCAMEGEEEDSGDPKALNNQPFWPKFYIFVAGAAMNFITGVVILLLLYAGAQAFYTPTITDFAEGCPLESAEGLQVGDTLLSIDGERVYVFSDVSLLFGFNRDGTFDLVVRRNGEKVHLNDLPMELREYRDQDGQPYRGYGLFFGAERADFGDRIAYAWHNTLDFVRLVRLSLKMLLNGDAGIKDMSGPVGIVTAITEVGEASETVGVAVSNIAYLAALIAVNLAMMNLLPLPALDGGKVLFLVLNAITMALFRRQIPSKYENYIHFAGLVLLLGLIAVISVSDVYKLFT
ncbi:MAG: site-2 protease family protein [Oscillospiraceae bacterium]|nr:site-2 protease family protein [Oscillospiraceae bacterium]